MSPRFVRTLAGSTLIGLLILPISALRAAAPIPNGPAFVENFDDPKLANWVTNGESGVNATYRVSGGKLILGNPNDNRENT